MLEVKYRDKIEQDSTHHTTTVGLIGERKGMKRVSGMKGKRVSGERERERKRERKRE
jgi:hypothetical protein